MSLAWVEESASRIKTVSYGQGNMRTKLCYSIAQCFNVVILKWWVDTQKRFATRGGLGHGASAPR